MLNIFQSRFDSPSLGRQFFFTTPFFFFASSPAIRAPSQHPGLFLPPRSLFPTPFVFFSFQISGFCAVSFVLRLIHEFTLFSCLFWHEIHCCRLTRSFWVALVFFFFSSSHRRRFDVRHPTESPLAFFRVAALAHVGFLSPETPPSLGGLRLWWVSLEVAPPFGLLVGETRHRSFFFVGTSPFPLWPLSRSAVHFEGVVSNLLLCCSFQWPGRFQQTPVPAWYYVPRGHLLTADFSMGTFLSISSLIPADIGIIGACGSCPLWASLTEHLAFLTFRFFR